MLLCCTLKLLAKLCVIVKSRINDFCEVGVGRSATGVLHVFCVQCISAVYYVIVLCMGA